MISPTIPGSGSIGSAGGCCCFHGIPWDWACDKCGRGGLCTPGICSAHTESGKSVD